MRILKLIIVCVLMGTLYGAESADDIIKKIQKKYDNIENFYAEFIQKDIFGMTQTVNEIRGKLYIKDGIKYLVLTEDQMICTDGKTVWTYSKMSNQVLIDYFKKDKGSFLPKDLLFKYPKNCYAAILEESKDHWVLKLDPKDESIGFVKTMKITVDKKSYVISKIDYTDFNDNNAIFEILKIDIETKLPDDLFVYKIQEGMDVVDLRL
jgi:outer membrane lipoprotein carrier protein